MDAVAPHLPKTGWLGQYMEYTDSLEACPRFRFFAAAAVLGAAINNKVWVQRGDPGLLPKLFPNIWVILIAPPGRGHKSSVINMAVNCLMQGCPEVRILSDKLTPEYLVKALAAPPAKQEPGVIRIGPVDATGLIKASEISVFFGKQTYNVGLVSLVTDLYDYREIWSSGTIGRGKEVLKNVCISILGGSTPDWLALMLPQDAFTGGFMSRFVLVEMPPKYAKREPFPKQLSQTGWKHLVDGLAKYSHVKGEFQWTQEAQERYAYWYEKYAPTGDAQKDAYREREAEQILKVAMLLSLSDDPDKRKLEGRYVDQAQAILNALREEVDPRIERLTTHPRMRISQEIQDLLKVHGEMSEGELLRRLYRSLSEGERQFYEALSILRVAGILGVKKGANQYIYYLRGTRDDK